MTLENGILWEASRIGLLILMVSMALVVIRLVRGPQAADRIVSLDLFCVLLVAFLALSSVFARQASFLDVAIAYALVAFLGTVAFARFLERSVAKRASQSKSEGAAHE
jgi:multicomponent Na+:H+ antiporter subunit F